MRRIITTTLAVLMLTAFVAEAQAQRRGNNDGPKKEWAEGQRGERPGMRLPGLTDEQKEQIEEIMLNGRKEALPIRNALRERKAELQTLRTSGTYDEAAVTNKIQEIADLETSMMLMRERHRQMVRELLTEEQRVIFDTRKPQHREGRGGPGGGKRG